MARRLFKAFIDEAIGEKLSTEQVHDLPERARIRVNGRLRTVLGQAGEGGHSFTLLNPSVRGLVGRAPLHIVEVRSASCPEGPTVRTRGLLGRFLKI